MAAETATTAMTAAMTPAHHKFSLRSDHAFLKIAMFAEDASTVSSDAKALKFAVDSSLKTVFGVMGASASDFDVLAVDKPADTCEPTTAILRVRKSGLEALWGALSMCPAVDGKRCKIQVLHVASTLLELASDRFL